MLLFFLILVVALHGPRACTASLQLGSRRPGDVMVCGANLDRPAQPGLELHENFHCRVAHGDQIITMARALYLGVRGREGSVNLAAIPKPNERELVLQMVSQSGEPLRYSINVFATPTTNRTIKMNKKKGSTKQGRNKPVTINETL